MSLRILLMLLLSSVCFGMEIKEVELDFDLKVKMPTDNLILLGLSPDFMAWKDWWDNRPTAKVLYVKPVLPAKAATRPKQKFDPMVFEAKSAGIVNRPISDFDARLLHDINTVRRLDPDDKHELISQNRFSVRTTIPFPPEWIPTMERMRAVNVLDDENTPYLEIVSDFEYTDLTQTPTGGPAVLRQREEFITKVDSINTYPSRPDRVNFQGMKQINQLASFGAMLSFYYDLKDGRTLVVNYFALAMKRRWVDYSLFNPNPIGMLGHSIFMGTNPINSATGIGAGLPKYLKTLLRNFYENWGSSSSARPQEEFED